jgi:hypothetical protein
VGESVARDKTGRLYAFRQFMSRRLQCTAYEVVKSQAPAWNLLFNEKARVLLGMRLQAMQMNFRQKNAFFCPRYQWGTTTGLDFRSRVCAVSRVIIDQVGRLRKRNIGMVSVCIDLGRLIGYSLVVFEHIYFVHQYLHLCTYFQSVLCRCGWQARTGRGHAIVSLLPCALLHTIITLRRMD